MSCISLYFSFVASPPRMWRSDLFFSRTFFTSPLKTLSVSGSLTVMSLCTVVVKMILFVKPYVGQKF